MQVNLVYLLRTIYLYACIHLAIFLKLITDLRIYKS